MKLVIIRRENVVVSLMTTHYHLLALQEILLLHRLPMIGRHFRGAIDHRRAQLRDPRVLKSFQDDLIADPIDVAMGHSHLDQLFIHIFLAYILLL